MILTGPRTRWLTTSLAALVALAAPGFLAAQERPATADLATRAGQLHASLLTVDLHLDAPMKMPAWDLGVRHARGYADLPRMQEGGLAAPFLAVFTKQAAPSPASRAAAKREALRALDLLDRMFARHGDLCEKALTVEDARRIFAAGKRAVFLGMENGFPVGTELANLDIFFRRGIRYLTLTHNAGNDICASATDASGAKDNGLSQFGARVVNRLNELGIMVDVSHISPQSFFAVIARSRAPVIASHSCARALRDHPRNLSDEQLMALKKNGGVIGITFVRDFLKRVEPDAEMEAAMAAVNERVAAMGGWPSLDAMQNAAFLAEIRAVRDAHPEAFGMVRDVVDHIDHVAGLIGVDHVGIGSDFDGGGYLADCKNVTQLRNITAELLRRGYSHQDIRKIWGENVLRVMRTVETVAAKTPGPARPPAVSQPPASR